MSAIHVVATIKAKAGKEKELEGLLTRLVEETHKEPGCVLYALHRAQSDSRTFIFVETWASETDLQTHLQAPHIADAMGRKDELIESIDIVPLVPMGQGKKGFLPLLVGQPPASQTTQRNKLTSTIATLGSLLIGVGVILFFASNWQKISPLQKMGLLLTALLGTYGAAALILIKKPFYQRLGRALLLLGALLYGANIFLVAQAYNISDHWPNGVLCWAFGILPLAFLFESRAISMFALSIASFWFGAEFLFSPYYGDADVILILPFVLWGAVLICIGLALKFQFKREAISPVFSTYGFLFIFGALFPFTFRLKQWIHPTPYPLFTEFSGKVFFLAVTMSLTVLSLAACLSSYLKDKSTECLAISIWGLSAILLGWGFLTYFNPSDVTHVVIVNIVYVLGVLTLLFMGYLWSSAHRVNVALLAFGAFVMGRYFDFAWKYMERSLAFILGGVLLLVMSISLEKGRRKLIGRTEAV